LCGPRERSKIKENLIFEINAEFLSGKQIKFSNKQQYYKKNDLTKSIKIQHP
jgi:hypothetical protein